MTAEGIETPLRILFARRQIFIGDFWAGQAYRDAHAGNRAEFLRLRKILDRLPGPVLAAVDSVVLHEEMPRNPRLIDLLSEGLDALFQQMQ